MAKLTKAKASEMLKNPPHGKSLSKKQKKYFGMITHSQDGSIIEDDMGQYNHPGKITKINSNDITMKGVPYPVLGVSDKGDIKLMKPNKNYKFKGKSVTEYPYLMDEVGQFNFGHMKDANYGMYIKPSKKMKKGQDGAEVPTLLENVTSAIPVVGGIVNAFGMIKKQKEAKKRSEQQLKLSKLVEEASALPIDKPKNKYVRPEDQLADPNELYPTYGTGTNFLAQMGATVKGPQYAKINPKTTPEMQRLNAEANLNQAVRFKNMLTGVNKNLVPSGDANVVLGDSINQPVGGGLRGYTFVDPVAIQKADSVINATRPMLFKKQQFGGIIEGINESKKLGSAGNALGSLLSGGGGSPTGEGMIGQTLGGALGSLVPIPGANIIGGALGGLVGGLIGGKSQKKIAKNQKESQGYLERAAFNESMKSMNSPFMKKGGMIPGYNMGGDVQTHWGGSANLMSLNPFLPEGGETIMFNGNSHENGGIGVTYGKTPVEVEGGEPAVKLNDGGSASDLVVFGDMKIPSYGVSELNDPKAKGKKFKGYIKDLSKRENSYTNSLNKGLDLVNDNEMGTSFDKLSFNSGKAIIEGNTMKLKNIAKKKQMASIIQNSILDTADELGLDSGKLAEGKIKKNKSKKAQHGKMINYYEDERPELSQPIEPIVEEESVNNSPALSNNDILNSAEMVFNAALPYFRPSNRMDLDPSQLSAEMMALGTNQLEPVQAQTYRPMLEQTYDISLQDQLNANQSDFNSAQRLLGNNPAALSNLAAQKYAANSSVLGEQFRVNQANKMGTYNRNREVLNDSTLRNLAILDQQYARQAQAKANTKATAQAALSSIADKIAKNKLENSTLGIYENLYNYRFLPNGQAWNLNPLAQFNTEGIFPINNQDAQVTDETRVKRDARGNTTGSETRHKERTNQKNGGLVRYAKNL